jgi:VIT1/CCC1 family predicted Fe2+/Mn2+ transporter
LYPKTIFCALVSRINIAGAQKQSPVPTHGSHFEVRNFQKGKQMADKKTLLPGILSAVLVPVIFLTIVTENYILTAIVAVIMLVLIAWITALAQKDKAEKKDRKDNSQDS